MWSKEFSGIVTYTSEVEGNLKCQGKNRDLYIHLRVVCAHMVHAPSYSMCIVMVKFNSNCGSNSVWTELNSKSGSSSANGLNWTGRSVQSLAYPLSQWTHSNQVWTEPFTSALYCKFAANVLPWLMSLILPADTRILCHWYSCQHRPTLRFLHSWYVGRHWLGQGSLVHSTGHPVSCGMTLRPSSLYGSILD